LCDLRAALPAFAHYTDAAVSRALKRLGVRLKRGRLRIQSPDPAYLTKLLWISAAWLRALSEPARVALVFGDEVSIYRQPTLADRFFPVGAEPTADLSHKANTRWRISGGLDGVTGAVTQTAAKVMGVEKLCAFLAVLRERYGEREIVLVWDNWPIHRHPEVLACASALRIHVLWLPTYAPWTNPIEKLWRWMRQEVIHHHCRADHWEEMKQAVTDFLDRFAEGSHRLLRYVGLLPD
jgi:transposase